MTISTAEARQQHFQGLHVLISAHTIAQGSYEWCEHGCNFPVLIGVASRLQVSSRSSLQFAGHCLLLMVVEWLVDEMR